MFKKILLSLAMLTTASISFAADFSFNLPKDWSIEQNTPFKAMASDSTAIITELPLNAQWQAQNLELINEAMTFMHQKQFGGEPGLPQPVKGKNWTGILQSQVSGLGGYEFQLVAKTKNKAYVFYMASPYPDLNDEEKQSLQNILLSLNTN